MGYMAYSDDVSGNREPIMRAHIPNHFQPFPVRDAFNVAKKNYTVLIQHSRALAYTTPLYHFHSTNLYFIFLPSFLSFYHFFFFLYFNKRFSVSGHLVYLKAVDVKRGAAKQSGRLFMGLMKF